MTDIVKIKLTKKWRNPSVVDMTWNLSVTGVKVSFGVDDTEVQELHGMKRIFYVASCQKDKAGYTLHQYSLTSRLWHLLDRKKTRKKKNTLSLTSACLTRKLPFFYPSLIGHNGLTLNTVATFFSLFDGDPHAVSLNGNTDSSEKFFLPAWAGKFDSPFSVVYCIAFW